MDGDIKRNRFLISQRNEHFKKEFHLAVDDATQTKIFKFSLTR